MIKETKKVKSFRTDKETDKFIRGSWKFDKTIKGNESLTIKTLIRRGYETLSSSAINENGGK